MALGDRIYLPPVQDAAERRLPECPRCGAWTGDPCRTPRLKTCRPHEAREILWRRALYPPGL